MDKKIIYAIPVLAVFLVGSYLLGLTNSVGTDLSAGIKYTGIVCPTVTRADGTIEQLECTHNTILNSGLNLIMFRLAGAGLNYPLNITVGNYSVTGGWKVCTANGFSGKNGTAQYNTDARNGNWSVYYTFTGTTAAQYVNHTRLVADGNATLFAMNNFTATTLQVGDQLKINWTIYVK